VVGVGGVWLRVWGRGVELGGRLISSEVGGSRGKMLVEVVMRLVV